jgi:menaquinone-9 beta-reductase
VFLFVGADGLLSRIARAAGALRRTPRIHKVSVTAHVTGAAVDRRFGELFVGERVCAGVAPLPDAGGHAARANITIVRPAAVASRVSALEMWRAGVAELPALQQRLADAAVTGPAGTNGVLACGPFDFPMRRIAGPGWVLVGDAAGYFDPFTGEGIHHALDGACRLAPHVTGALQRGDPVVLDVYERAQRRLLRAAHRVQRAVDAVITRPRLAGFTIAALARSPGARAALIGVTADLAPPHTLLSPRVIVSFFADNLRYGP